jgi:O-antigen/teichoic acid export membrane protein
MGVVAQTKETMVEPLKALPLRWNFAWTFAGNVVYAACQWGMLVALAKLGSPEMVGQFALGLAICAPVMMLANFQLRSVQGTDARNEYRFGDYLALRLTMTILAFGLICLIAWLAVERWQTALVIVLVGVARSVESISDVIYGLMLKHERLDRIAIAMILRGVGSVTLFTLVIWQTRNVAWAVCALAVWWGTVLLTYERKAGRALLKTLGSSGDRFSPFWEWYRMRRLAWLSFPLGIVMVLVSLNTNIPRYFVEHYLGEAALGYFAALGYVMVAGYTVMGALGQSALPRLARYYESKPAQFRRLLAKMLTVAVGVGTVGIVTAILWGRPLLTVLYRRDYARHADLFLWLMIAAAVSYVSSMLSYGMTAARIFRPQVPLFASCGAVILAFCALFIGSYGMIAGAWALLAGQCVAALGAGGVLIFRARSARKYEEVAGA